MTEGSLLPATLREAVAAQFARELRSPYLMLIVVSVNGLLMTGGWFLLPNPNILFNYHGALAFAMVLACWMYSDVPATNVLGSDARRITAALEDPAAFIRLLTAKNIVLWIMVAPVCSLIAIGVGIHEHRLTATIFSLAWIAVVPLGALALSAWAGIYFPYHPLPLRTRWEHRRPFKRMILRWLILSVLPYGLFPVVAIVLSIPTLLVWTLSSQSHVIKQIPDTHFAIGVVIGCVISLSAWYWGNRHGVRIAERRRVKLIAFLADDLNG